MMAVIKAQNNLIFWLSQEKKYYTFIHLAWLEHFKSPSHLFNSPILGYHQGWFNTGFGMVMLYTARIIFQPE